jgi:hypothetical protein
MLSSSQISFLGVGPLTDFEAQVIATHRWPRTPIAGSPQETQCRVPVLEVIVRAVSGRE